MDSQICKKFFHDKFGQNDEMDKEIDEYIEFFNKIKLPGSVDELTKSPEIVAFLNSKNFPTELLEYFVQHFDPSLFTCQEDAFEAGLLLEKKWTMKKEIKRGILIALSPFLA